MNVRLNITLVLLSFSTVTMSSTFLGNGGQSGDIELTVSLKQIRAAADVVEERSEKKSPQLCYCPEEYSDHQLCEIINMMNVAQKKYCSDFLQSQFSELKKASTQTRFEWVDESMINESKSGSREVEAVAQKEKKLILIDRSNFLERSPAQRTFLIAHELFHFVPHKGGPLNDEDPIGPFDQANGTRFLLNAAAASLVMLSIEENVYQDYTGYLKMSRPHRKHWFSVDVSDSPLKETEKTNFNIESSRNFKFSYRYLLNNDLPWFVGLQGATGTEKRDLFSQTKLTRAERYFSYGVGYRLFPFKHLNILDSSWASFVLIEAQLEHQSVSLNFNEIYTDYTEQATATAPKLSMQYFYPIKSDFWMQFGVDYRDSKFYFSTIDYELKMKGLSFFLGVTYGL